jgi:glycine betaine/proline transport system ATP-binding protein
MSKLEIQNLYKVFGPQPKDAVKKLKKGMSKDEMREQTGHVAGLDDISLSIEPGEIFVIMGLSGSGKSTLIRCINRLIEPTAGHVLVDGVDILGLNDQSLRLWRRTKTGMVFQRFGLFPHRSVLENIAYGLEVQGTPKNERQQKAMQWTETVGLKGWHDAYPSQLSGGMQQRVGIARALCNDPEILLMDEPFSALDPLIRREMQDEMLDLQSKLHKTIIFITHDLDEALRLGDRIAILKDGRLIQVGKPEEILTQPADDYVADFTRDVNRSRILRARNVMVKPRLVITEKDGPRTALKQMEEQGLSTVFVVDRDRRYHGLVTVDDAVAAVQRGEKNLQGILTNGVPKTHPDALLEELLPLAAEHRFPIAVLNEAGVLLGVVPRVAVLAALAGPQLEAAATVTNAS